jgi:hypothetical protein
MTGEIVLGGSDAFTKNDLESALSREADSASALGSRENPRYRAGSRFIRLERLRAFFKARRVGESPIRRA